jgi:hypothetical protein
VARGGKSALHCCSGERLAAEPCLTEDVTVAKKKAAKKAAKKGGKKGSKKKK